MQNAFKKLRLFLLTGTALMLVGSSNTSPVSNFSINQDTVNRTLPFMPTVPVEPEDELGTRKDPTGITPDSRKTPTAPHAPYGVKDPILPPTPVSGIQFEMGSFNPVKIIQGTLRFSERHCHAAADIKENTAQNIARYDFNVRCMNTFIGTRKFKKDEASLIENSDVITMSYITRSERDKKGWRVIESFLRSSTLQDNTEYLSLKKYWQNAQTISVQGAGNDGVKGRDDLQRHLEYVTDLNDTHLRVGAAKKDGNDNSYIDYYSSPTAPMVVTYNPFENGFNYRYFYTKSEISTFIDRAFQSMDDLNKVKQCKTKNDFNFDQNKARVKDCILKEFKRSYDAALLKDINGTSFTAPHLSGMVLATKGMINGLYGSDILTSYDYFTLIALSATPIAKAEMLEGNKKASLSYNNNGAGLYYNNNYAGFGVVDYTVMQQKALEMAQAVQENPSLKSQETFAHYNFTADNMSMVKDGKKHIISFNIEDEGITLRSMLRLKFDGGAQKVPERITLISPDGGRITISPSKEVKEDLYSFASTNGFIGNNLRGTWQIEIPKKSVLQSFDFSVSTVQKGSIAEQAIKQHTAKNNGKIKYTSRSKPKPFTF